MSEGQKPYSLLGVNLVYLTMGIVFIILGSLLQHWNFTIGILATEYGMLVLPAWLFMFLKRQSIRQAFRFKKPKLKELGLVLLAGICFIPGIAFLNSIINVWLIYGLKVTPPQIPTGQGAIAPLVTFLIAAVTPGLCEEFFFRGMILSEYEKRMTAYQAAVVTALMFGLFHYNIMNFWGPAALGLIFAWTIQVTDCFWNAMMGHMVNNSLAVIMIYATSGVSQEASKKAIEDLGNSWPLVAIIMLVFLAFIGTISGLLGLYILKMIRKDHLKVGDQLKIKNRFFDVMQTDGSRIWVSEFFQTTSENESMEWIETTDKKLFSNRDAQLINAHWQYRWDGSLFKWKEWWPVWLSVLIYIAFNGLSLYLMIA